MKYHIVTLGCPKNTVDSEGMAGLLMGEGHRAVDSAEAADVVIVNTCSFIQAARTETVGVLRDLANAKRPDQRLIAAGCMAESHREQLVSEIAGLDATLGTKEWTSMPAMLAQLESPTTPPTESAAMMIPLTPLTGGDTLGAYG